MQTYIIMLGAIIGDIAGSTFEFDNVKTKDIPLFAEGSSFTDDTICSIAVAEWLLEDPTHTLEGLEKKLVELGMAFPYPMGGYGKTFSTWLFHPRYLRDCETEEKLKGRKPYHSCGNGSAMRVSAVGWYFDTLEETERVAGMSADVTHNHPEGIKGAQAVAAAIFMAKTGATKNAIKAYIEESMVTIFTVHAMIFDLHTSSQTVAHILFLLPLSPFLKVQTLRTLSVLPFRLEETVTRLLA